MCFLNCFYQVLLSNIDVITINTLAGFTFSFNCHYYLSNLWDLHFSNVPHLNFARMMQTNGKQHNIISGMETSKIIIPFLKACQYVSMKIYGIEDATVGDKQSPGRC